ESVFYVSAGTLGEVRPAHAPSTILLANLTAAGDGRFYQWDVTDPADIRPLLVEHPAYELPRIAKGAAQALAAAGGRLFGQLARDLAEALRPAPSPVAVPS